MVSKKTKLDSDLTSSGEIGIFDDLDSFKSELKKEFGDSTALSDDDFITSFIPTNIAPLDYLLGGGIPQGKMIEIVGKEGTGKSSLGIYMLSQIQKQGGLGVLIDSENGAGDRFRFENFGVDTKKCIISVEDLAEKAFAQIERVGNYIVKKNLKVPSLLVLDSVAGLTTRAEQEADYDTNNVAITARMIKKGIQRTKLLCKETNLAVIFVNQARVKIGGMANMYMQEYTSPGGDTLKFQAITRLFLEKGKTLGDTKLPDGHIVKAKIIKCKTSSCLGRTLPMRFYYDKRAYSNPHIIYDVLVDSGYLGSTAWKTISLPDGSEKRFNSESTFIELFNASKENENHFITLMKDAFKKNLNFNKDSIDDIQISDSYENLN